MSRTTLLPIAVAALVLLSARDSSATLVLPDAEFSFSAPVMDASVATAAVQTALQPLGFKITERPRVRSNSFFRAEFERPAGAVVSLAGRVFCVHVGIYTSFSHEPKEPEAVKREAAEIYDQLLTSLRAAVPDVFLFKSAGAKGGCEEEL